MSQTEVAVGGRGWVEVRGGWGLGDGRDVRWPTNVTTTFNKHNNNNFLK